MVDSLNPDVMRKNIRDLNVKNSETLYQVGELENVVGSTPMPEGVTLTDLATSLSISSYNNDNKIDLLDFESSGTSQSNSVTLTQDGLVSWYGTFEDTASNCNCDCVVNNIRVFRKQDGGATRKNGWCYTLPCHKGDIVGVASLLNSTCKVVLYTL